MVSHVEPRRRGLVPLTARVALLLAGLMTAPFVGCSRRAEIEDPIVSELPPTPAIPLPDGGVPLVEDSELEVGDGSCEGREGQSACVGTNDFTCAFDRWILQLSEACQTQTGCHTNGWLEV